MKATFLAALFLSCILLSNSAPIFDDLDLDLDFSLPEIPYDCTNLGCPAGTTSCSKQSTTSEDKTKIITTLKCYNQNGLIGQPIEKTENNPNPGSIINSYEFYGSFSSSNTGHSNNSNGNTHITSTTNDQIETFTP